jgi:DNA-binding MarR family transcriptional regulator
MNDELPLTVTREVRYRCLCLYLQRSARAIGRLFDDALRPFNLTNGQFSLLMSMNRPEAPKIGDVAALLAMDRTTLTANLKPLERRGLITVSPDPADKRSRRLHLTQAGEELLIAAVPTWRETHDEVDRMAGDADMDELRATLERLSHPG